MARIQDEKIEQKLLSAAPPSALSGLTERCLFPWISVHKTAIMKIAGFEIHLLEEIWRKKFEVPILSCYES